MFQRCGRSRSTATGRELKARKLARLLVLARIQALGGAGEKGIADSFDFVYELVKSDTFKKMDFAMTILSANADWEVPNYIVDGLRWLELRLHGPIAEA
jgi:hypothetical protein